MRWWLRSRRIGLLTAAALVQTALLAVAGDERVPVPSLLRAATVPVAAAVFIPLLAVGAFQLGLEGRDRRLERVSVQQIPRLDAGLALAFCGALLLLGLTANLAGANLALAGARNAAGYLGLGLVAGWIAGERVGVIVPAAYVVLVGLFASGTPTERRPWEWPLLPEGSAVATGAACLLLAAGVAALLAPQRLRIGEAGAAW